MEQNFVLDSYRLEAWITTFGSVPVELIASEDFSESYEMDAGHVYRLENGKFATVFESGCSCYEARDAAIELFPTKEAAMEQFDAWVKGKKQDRHERGY